MKVYFVGAGPGDPELITVKGRRLLHEAGVVVYAGSLVNPELLALVPPSASLYDSAAMNLEQVVEALAQGVAEGRKVVRLHSGEPSLYGAIQEQMAALDQRGIGYEVVPGVSSFAAAAAAVRREYTVPGGSQTVILTRLAGRTPVPPREDLQELARHRASLCIFLSVDRLDEVVEKLSRHYPPETAVAVVYRASWPQEKVVRGTLADIVLRVDAAGIKRTALILVGDFLETEGRSLLYDAGFSHGYRQS